jgi:hypothetical protein
VNTLWWIDRDFRRSRRRRRRAARPPRLLAEQVLVLALRAVLANSTWRRHPAPYNKRPQGAQRRATRQHKQRQRAALLPDREYDDGYFPMNT